MAYIKKADREQIEQLNEYLNIIGMPDKWNTFLQEEKRKEYLIIKSKGEYHCLFCNNKFQSNAKINECIECPKCKSHLLIKSDRLTKYEAKKDLILIQKYTDSYVFRTFELDTWFSNNKMSFDIVEWAREIIDKNFNTTKFYISNNLKNNMGCLTVSHYEKTTLWKPYCYNWLLNITGRYYYYNFKELFYEYNKYSMIWDLAKNVETLNFNEVARDCLILKNNTVELLTKSKLYNLANHCEKYNKKENFKKIFGIDKSYLNFMIENNITSDELKILSKIKIKNIDLIRYLDKFGYYELDNLLKHCNLLDLYKYKLNPKNVHIYLDYLEFAQKLGFDIKNKKYLYPKNLKQKHDQYMNQIKINKNKIINNKIKSKYKKLIKNKFEYKKYIIVPADSIQSLINESSQQNNCVKTYAERIAKNECDIYFMRYIDSLDKSLVTIEVKNNKVVQQRIKNNADTNSEQKKIIKLWENKILNRGDLIEI